MMSSFPVCFSKNPSDWLTIGEISPVDSLCWVQIGSKLSNSFSKPKLNRQTYLLHHNNSTAINTIQIAIGRTRNRLIYSVQTHYIVLMRAMPLLSVVLVCRYDSKFTSLSIHQLLLLTRFPLKESHQLRHTLTFASFTDQMSYLARMFDARIQIFTRTYTSTTLDIRLCAWIVPVASFLRRETHFVASIFDSTSSALDIGVWAHTSGICPAHATKQSIQIHGFCAFQISSSASTIRCRFFFSKNKV